MPRITRPMHPRWSDLDANGHVNTVLHLDAASGRPRRLRGDERGVVAALTDDSLRLSGTLAHA